MRSVLLRHFPALEPALEGVANPFAPWRSVVSPPPTPAEDGLAEAARVALGGIRLLNGTLALVAPRWLARRMGAPPEAVPSMVYPLRMFGVRTVLLGADLWRGDDAVREHAVRKAPVVHATDVAAAVLAGAGGKMPRRSAAVAAGISTLNVALSLLAGRRRRVR
jgi:hypothetical protein